MICSHYCVRTGSNRRCLTTRKFSNIWVSQGTYRNYWSIYTTRQRTSRGSSWTRQRMTWWWPTVVQCWTRSLGALNFYNRCSGCWRRSMRTRRTISVPLSCRGCRRRRGGCRWSVRRTSAAWSLRWLSSSKGSWRSSSSWPGTWRWWPGSSTPFSPPPSRRPFTTSSRPTRAPTSLIYRLKSLSTADLYLNFITFLMASASSRNLFMLHSSSSPSSPPI